MGKIYKTFPKNIKQDVNKIEWYHNHIHFWGEKTQHHKGQFASY